LTELLPFSRGQIGLAVRDMLLAGVITVDRPYEVGSSDQAIGA
jgi:hypothetical protein